METYVIVIIAVCCLLLLSSSGGAGWWFLSGPSTQTMADKIVSKIEKDDKVATDKATILKEVFDADSDVKAGGLIYYNKILEIESAGSDAQKINDTRNAFYSDTDKTDADILNYCLALYYSAFLFEDIKIVGMVGKCYDELDYFNKPALKSQLSQLIMKKTPDILTNAPKYAVYYKKELSKLSSYSANKLKTIAYIPSDVVFKQPVPDIQMQAPEPAPAQASAQAPAQASAQAPAPAPAQAPTVPQLKEGDTVKCDGKSFRYIKGVLRYYPSPDIAASWNPDWANVKAETCAIPQGDPLGQMTFQDAKDFYLARNPDVAAAGADAWEHYKTSGQNEKDTNPSRIWLGPYGTNYGGNNGSVDGKTYCIGGWESADGKGKNLACEYGVIVSSGKVIGCENPAGEPAQYKCAGEPPLPATFEEAKQSYLLRNPDVASAGVDAWEHYKTSGQNEIGTTPSRRWLGPYGTNFMGNNGSVDGKAYCIGAWESSDGKDKNLGCEYGVVTSSAKVVDCASAIGEPTQYKCAGTPPPPPFNEGEAVDCGAEGIFRYMDGKLWHYPTPEIASSWDPNWGNSKKGDCNLPRAGDVGMMTVNDAKHFYKVRNPDTVAMDPWEHYKQFGKNEIATNPARKWIGPQPSARFYTDLNYTGNVSTLSIGEYPSPVNFPEVGNDSISSIQIDSGVTVTVYGDANFNGDSKTLTASVPDLRAIGFNDNISSIKIF